MAQFGKIQLNRAFLVDLPCRKAHIDRRYDQPVLIPHRNSKPQIESSSSPSTHSSDKYLERRWHVALCGFVAAACFLLLPLAVGSLAMTVVLLALASVGIFSVLSLFWTIPSAYLSRSAAAGGLALISSIGSFGGAVSPAMIGAVKMHTGSLYFGLDVIAILLVIWDAGATGLHSCRHATVVANRGLIACWTTASTCWARA